MKIIALGVAIVASLVPCTGCGGSSRASFGEEHRVPADNRPTSFGMGMRERFGFEVVGAPQGSTGSRFVADVPDHWQTQPPDSSRFRDLRWFIGGDEDAECYLTASVGGGLMDNVARWCEQFGKPMLSAAEIAALPRHSLLGQEALVLELDGTFRGRDDVGMLILIVQSGGALQSTFRATAPKAVIDAERQNILDAAASVRAATASDPAPMGPQPAPSAGTGGGSSGEVPPGHAADPAGHGAATSAPFTASIPDDWVRLDDSGMKVLRHRFGGNGEVYVGQLGGSVDQMLGIWCSEMSAPVPDAAGIAALPRVPMLGGDAVLLELAGEHRGFGGEAQPDARLLVAVRQTDRGVVFAKCVGPAADVEAARAGFLRFCESLKWSQ